MASSFAIALGAASPMTQDEKVFFQQLGARIAALRKDQSLTQVQFAEILGLTQQMIASYEVGRRRVPVSLLPAFAARVEPCTVGASSVPGDVNMRIEMKVSFDTDRQRAVLACGDR
jgi:transcriptional regulator with XRE-family HTH domain